MKRILLSLIFVSSINVSFAQSFDVTTNYVQFSGPFSSSDIPSPYWLPTIHNLSGDTIELRWVRIEENYTGNWRTSVCREMYCYSIPDDSGSWQMLPGDSDMLYVHLYPYNYADTGNVVLKIFDVNNPSDSVRVMFHCDALTGIEEHDPFTELQIDNSNGQVTYVIQQAGMTTVVDCLGQEMCFAAKGPGRYSMRLKPGLYVLTFEDENGKTFTRKILL